MTMHSEASRHLPQAPLLDSGYKANPYPHYRDWVMKPPLQHRLKSVTTAMPSVVRSPLAPSTHTSRVTRPSASICEMRARAVMWSPSRFKPR